MTRAATAALLTGAGILAGMSAWLWSQEGLGVYAAYLSGAALACF